MCNTSALPLLCVRFDPFDGTNDESFEHAQHVDALNERIVAAINTTGKTYLSHAVTQRGYVIRISIGNIQTRQEDIELLWDLLTSTANELAHAFMHDYHHLARTPA